MAKLQKREIREANENAVRSRLAAGEVISAAGNRIFSGADQYKDQIREKIMNNMGCTGTEAENVHSKLVDLFQNAELTINFRPKFVFESMSPDNFKNAFEMGDQAPGYMRRRDEVENQLFRYNSPENAVDDVQDVIDRIRRRGDYQSGANPAFDPGIRPRYGALNILNLRTGAARQYGRSHLILKDYVKHRCTFTRTDSLHLPETDIASQLANIFELDKIIKELGDTTFAHLCSLVTTGSMPSGVINDLIYIEAQIHSEILFSRDVKKIRLDKWELKLGSEEGKSIVENIALLACQHGIPVEVFN